MKKRIFAALSAMLMLLALAGCGAKQVDYDATCTISISCATILDNMDACDPDKREQVPQDGVILAPVEVGFQTGENVFDVLQRVCRENRIQMESKWTPLYESAYIQGIHNLYEFDVGSGSGWMYSVNDWYPNYGCSCYTVQPGDVILLHAAAGGVGLIASQWARYLGATVIGTVGSEEKAELARAHGCHYTILYNRENVAERVRELTDGQGVAVVYDSVGKDTFMGSLDSLRPMGMMVSFGHASGPVPAFEPAILAAKGSLFLTRPTLMTYTAKRSDLLASAAELFTVVASGAVQIEVRQTYSLAETAQAHRDLEARKTTGSTVLLP